MNHPSSEWREMDSAPEDGSEIVGFDPVCGVVVMHWKSLPQSYGTWIALQGLKHFLVRPKKWMPIADLDDTDTKRVRKALTDPVSAAPEQQGAA